MPISAYHVQADIDRSLRSAVRFVEAMHDEIDQILGSVGMSADMRDLLEASTLCWGWASLVDQRPNADHVKAFLKLATFLRPFLGKTLWPGPTLFPDLQRHWDLSDFELSKQYLILLQRVRRMASLAKRVQDACVGGMAPQNAGGLAPQNEVVGLEAEALRAASNWVTVVGYNARPMWCFSMVFVIMTKIVQKFALIGSATVWWKLCAARVSVFLGEWEGHVLPGAAFDTVFVSASNMGMLVVRNRKRDKKKRTACV